MKQSAGILMIALFLASCETEDVYVPEGNNGNNPLVFYSLTTDKDTLRGGEIAKITARATGYTLSFAWSATAGTILGSGNEVNYAACSCQSGKNIITCTVTDRSNNSESREVSIFVH